MSRHARILFPVILVMIVLSGCDSCEEDKPVFPNTVFFIPPAAGDYGVATNYNINNATFGKITSTTNGFRIVQIGAYFRF